MTELKGEIDYSMIIVGKLFCPLSITEQLDRRSIIHYMCGKELSKDTYKGKSLREKKRNVTT